METINSKNSKSEESYINEYKGNLFEYLVASNLNTRNDSMIQFYQSLSDAYKEELKNYQHSLFKLNESLYNNLTSLSLTTSNNLHEYLLDKKMIEKQKGFFKVIGKEKSFVSYENEADILFIGDKKNIPLSLKLSKPGAFVNTKSGGIKSFISKYFSLFENSGLLQREFNQFVDESFINMGQTLYDKNGLIFEGEFDSQWTHSKLPGEQVSEVKDIIYQHYHNLNLRLFTIIEGFYLHDLKLFQKSLIPLLGHSTSDTIQITCYPNNIKGTQIDIDDLGHIQSGEKLNCTLEPPQSNTSFNVNFLDRILQIRIKPMKEFTTASYKINCSVKKIAQQLSVDI